jgi:hypothetical protein
MHEIPNYPENRLDIRMDQYGRITYEQNAEFAKYYAPGRADLEDELEELNDRLELLEMDEPENLYGDEHDEWEDERRRLEEAIEEMEERLEGMK